MAARGEKGWGVGETGNGDEGTHFSPVKSKQWGCNHRQHGNYQ